MLNQIIRKTEPQMEEMVEKFSEELKKVQAGKINPSLIEDFKVSCYNSLMPIKTIASVAVLESNLITVTPWDKLNSSSIESGLKTANLGLGITNDGNSLRLILPPLSEDGRKDLLKQVSRMAEEARIGLRNLRERSWKEVQEAEKRDEISEDDRYRGESELNKLIEKYNHKIAELVKAKKREIEGV